MSSSFSPFMSLNAKQRLYGLDCASRLDLI